MEKKPVLYELISIFFSGMFWAVPIHALLQLQWGWVGVAILFFVALGITRKVWRSIDILQRELKEYEGVLVSFRHHVLIPKRIKWLTRVLILSLGCVGACIHYWIAGF